MRHRFLMIVSGTVAATVPYLAAGSSLTIVQSTAGHMFNDGQHMGPGTGTLTLNIIIPAWNTGAGTLTAANLTSAMSSSFSWHLQRTEDGTAYNLLQMDGSVVGAGSANGVSGFA